MTTAMSSLPSIKISKTTSIGNFEPVTPNSDVETPETPMRDPERPGTGGRRDSQFFPCLGGNALACLYKDNYGANISIDVAGPKASNGSFANDGDKPATPPPKGRRGTLGSIQRESSTVDPVTLQILRRTGTENAIPKALRGDGNEDSEKTAAQGSNGRLPDNMKLGGGGNKKYQSQLHTLPAWKLQG
jgi:hypothetical protein